MMLADVKLSDIRKHRESGTCPECGEHSHNDFCSRPKDPARPEYYEGWNLFNYPVDPFNEESRKRYEEKKAEFFAKRDAALARKAGK